MVNPAAVDYLVVTTSFASPDVAGTAGTVTVAAYDVYNNPDSSGPNQFEGTVDLSSTDPQLSGLPAIYTFTAADAGSHTFSGVALETAGNQTITAAQFGRPNVAGTSAAVNVMPAPASVLVITSTPLDLTAGSRGGPITVQLEDAFSNPGATSTAAQTISLSTTSPAGAFYARFAGGSAITSVTIASGASSATFYYSDTTAGTPTVTASDGAFNSSPSQQDTVKAAAASQVAITGAPLSFLAGNRGGPITVQLEDAYGNTGAISTVAQTIGLGTTSSAGAFYASQSGGSAIASVKIAAGVSSATFYYGDALAGTPTVTASDSAFSSSSSQQETVEAAAATQVAITGAPASLIAGSRGGPITVQLEDASGNTGATSTVAQTIGLGSSSPAGVFYANQSGGSAITSVTIPAGQSSATVYYSDTAAGTPTVTASDSAFSSSSSQQETVEAAAATQVAIAGSPTSLIAGSRGGPITVQLEDAYGNTEATSTTPETIGLGSTSPAGAFYAGQSGGGVITSVEIPAGQSAATVYYGDTEAGHPTVTASDSALGSSSNQQETVNPAAVDHFVLTVGFANPDVAGTAGMVMVAAYDAYGNLESSGPNQYLGTVDLVSTDGQITGLPVSYAFNAGDAGSHTFSNVVLETAGSQTIGAVDSVTGSINGGASVDVVPAAASQVAITSSPLTLVAGLRGPVTVQLEDAYGNTGAISTSDQAVGLGSTSTAGAFYANPSGGNPTTDIPIPAGQSSATFYYGDTQAGTPTITAYDAALGPAPPSKRRSARRRPARW